MNIAELLNEFRDMSYETGWISGKIEAGGNHSESDQDSCIAKRNELEADLTNRIAAMVEALEKAPKPMASLTAEELKDNWKAVDHWFTVYDSWMEDVATKALTQVKTNKTSDSEREK